MSTDTKVEPPLSAILERYIAGEISAPVTLMQLLIETEDLDRVRATLSAMDETLSVEQAATLNELFNNNEAGCERIAAMLRADVDSPRPARTVEEGIAFCERLFDWSVQQSEEASVALYSLGNPELLEKATAEIVAQLSDWGAVTPENTVLDIGCGIGRMLIALAPRIRQVIGIDLSAKMVDAARRRCADLPNVTVIKGDGRGLTSVENATCDVALAVDSFPYFRQSGYELVNAFFTESARVLKPGGQLIILNYSYSEDDDADSAEVRELAVAHGFEVLEAATRPFEMWDGVAFRLRRFTPPSSGARPASD
ncbi:MAG TPA: methyltransferase domain-containing protein [Gemmatimonadaceae bacterium]